MLKNWRAHLQYWTQGLHTLKYSTVTHLRPAWLSGIDKMNQQADGCSSYLMQWWCKQGDILWRYHCTLFAWEGQNVKQPPASKQRGIFTSFGFGVNAPYSFGAAVIISTKIDGMDCKTKLLQKMMSKIHLTYFKTLGLKKYIFCGLKT